YRDAARRVVREHVMAAGAGVERIFYYWGWRADESYYIHTPINGSMFEPTGAPKPMAVAYGVLAWMIDGFDAVRKIELGQDRQGYVFEHGDKDAVVVLWSLADQDSIRLHSIRDTCSLCAYNLMGNPINLHDDVLALTNEPIYLKVPADFDTAQLLVLLKGPDRSTDR
ncbi:MAG: hypothetical protein HRF48_08275, partial [Chloroflexota bacterium]